MEYLADAEVLLAPFAIMMLVLAAITWFAMLGVSLQWSLGMFVKEPPGYFRCLGMAGLIGVINIVVSLGFYYAFGPQPWYVVACYLVMLQVFLVVIVARVNPFAAVAAAITHLIFGSIGTVMVFGFFLSYLLHAYMDWEERTGSEGRYLPRGPISEIAPQPAQIPIQDPAVQTTNPFFQ